MSGYKYDVGISYATEDGRYVGRVIKLLKDLYHLDVFFAPEEQRKMIGEDLLVYLNRVYKDECHYVVLFVSEQYLTKEYPRQEAAIIKLRQMAEDYRFIIPVVFGSAKLDWLSEDVVYMSGDKATESEIAYYISEKVKGSKGEHKSSSKLLKNIGEPPVNIYGENANIIFVDSITGSDIQSRK